jgi:hypothetical protein
LQSDSSLIQDSKVISTFESVNKWKATLFSRPIKYLIKRSDGTEVKYDYTHCYVGVSPADSNTVHIIWQFVFVNILASGNFLPDKFVLGPAEGNKLCLAFKYPYPTTSLCYFILNTDSEVNLYKEADDAFNDIQSPNIHVQEQDPNNVIPLSNILVQNKLSDIGTKLVTINSVCCFDNSTVFDLSDETINFILLYSIVDGKPDYSVYKLTDLSKNP